MKGQVMTCKECKTVFDRPMTEYVGPTDPLPISVELCPRHALTDRLAEALRHYATPGTGVYSSPQRITHDLLAEYNSAKKG